MTDFILFDYGFVLGISTTTSWPPLWYITDKNGDRNYLPCALKTITRNDKRLHSIILGPLSFTIGIHNLKEN